MVFLKPPENLFTILAGLHNSYLPCGFRTAVNSSHAVLEKPINPGKELRKIRENPKLLYYK
jgi:hypothetical protein